MRTRRNTLDHIDCGISGDQVCKWGIEWDGLALSLRHGASKSSYEHLGCKLGF
jgi:hypothetical protein